MFSGPARGEGRGVREEGRASQLPAEGDPALLRDFLHDSVGCLRGLYQKYGPIVAYSKGSNPTLFAFGQEYNRELHTNPEAFWLSSGFPGPKNSPQRRFSHGLFGLNGDKHQQARRLLMPPFRKEAVENYHPSLVRLVEQMLAGWRPGQVRDLARDMQEFALRVTSNILFGIDDLETARAIEILFEEWMDLNHETYFAAILPIAGSTNHYERLLSAAARLEAHLHQLLQQRQAAGPGGNDLLAVLLRLQAEGLLSEAEVVGHLHTLFNAAYHTTTSALTWSFFLLAQHPFALHELLGELTARLDGGAPSVAQLGRLPLLERVIKEGLRILPPVVYSPRISRATAALGAYVLPPGATVVASHYVTHHMPDLFTRPEHFLPERWRETAPSPYAYFPFGAGPRMCVGAAFALHLLKVTLSMVWQRFRVTVIDGIRIDRHATLTLGPRQGIPVLIHAQDGRFRTCRVEGNIHEMVEFPDERRGVSRAA